MSAGPLTAPVLVIADAAPDSGLGHLARCEAVVQAMVELGVPCMRYAFGDCDWPAWTCIPSIDQLPRGSPALLLVDSYMLDGHSLRASLSAERVAAFHDVGPIPGWADLVVSTEIDAPGSDARVIGGFDHVCLGSAYWRSPPPRDIPNVVRTIVVTTGGADPGAHAATLAVVAAKAVPTARVTVVRGPQARFAAPPGVELLDAPSGLADVFHKSDMALTSAGNSLLEALAVGVPALGVVVAGNQKELARAVARRGAADCYAPGEVVAIGRALTALAAEPDERRSRSVAGRELVDGQGARRVARRLADLL